jgi:hypothetical protein
LSIVLPLNACDVVAVTGKLALDRDSAPWLR